MQLEITATMLRVFKTHYCYVKSFQDSYIILMLYVDDILIVGASVKEINNLKKRLSK